MNRVAFVIPGLDRLGGAERQVILLAKGLAKRDWRVSVIALSGSGGEAGSGLIVAGVEFLTLKMRKGLADPRGWVRLHRFLRSRAPEVVHAHLPHAAWIARVSRLLAPVRVLVDTIHTTASGSCLQRLAYRGSRWLPDRVTTVSSGAQAACIAAGVASSSRVVVEPNAIDTDEWRLDSSARAAIRSETGLTDEFLWLACGRLEPVKDYPSLLHAFALLPDHARLAIAGSGCLERDLRSLSAKLGIEDRVHFLGFRNDIRRIMQAADAFVLSSLWEGLPMCLLEAGACGLPSVATDVPGTREVVTAGETGYLASPGDSDSLRAAMIRMMQMSPENRCALGMNARQRIVENYRLGRILDRWEELYKELLERSPHAKRWAGAL